MTSQPYPEPDDEPGVLLGAVVEQDRGALPFALVHGEALVACAAWALGEAGITPVDLDAGDGTGWLELALDAGAGRAFVLHDALCPMTPAGFLVTCAQRAEESGAVVVGVRPVTDTVKETADGLVGATVDREGLRAVASPVVLPAPALPALAEAGGLPTHDFAGLVDWLAQRFPVTLVEAPPEARRVGSLDDVRLLEALTSR